MAFSALVTSASKEVCDGRFNDELISLLLALATLGEDSVERDLTIASFVAALVLSLDEIVVALLEKTFVVDRFLRRDENVALCAFIVSKLVLLEYEPTEAIDVVQDDSTIFDDFKRGIKSRLFPSLRVFRADASSSNALTGVIEKPTSPFLLASSDLLKVG